MFFLHFSKMVLGHFFLLPSPLPSYFVLRVMCWLLSNPSYRLQQAVAILLIFFFSFATIFLCFFFCKSWLYCWCSSMHFRECRLRLSKLTINHSCWLFLCLFPCNVSWDYCLFEINVILWRPPCVCRIFVLKHAIRRLPWKFMFIEACVFCIPPAHGVYLTCLPASMYLPVYSEACSESKIVFLVLPCMRSMEQCWQLNYGLTLSVSVTVCLQQGYRLLYVVSYILSRWSWGCRLFSSVMRDFFFFLFPLSLFWRVSLFVFHMSWCWMLLCRVFQWFTRTKCWSIPAGQTQNHLITKKGDFQAVLKQQRLNTLQIMN